MAIPRSWATAIRGRWSEPMIRSNLALLISLSLPLAAQDPVASLKQGSAALNDGKPAAAIAPLRAAQRGLPRIADYTAFFLAQAYAQTKDHASAASAVTPVFDMKPESPVAGYAAVLAAKSLIEVNDYRGAIAMIERVAEARRPQPSTLATLAKAYEGMANHADSARAWQRVYFEFPITDDAREAATAMARIRAALGKAYPEPPGEARLDRADRLRRARDFAKARAEYQGIASDFGGLVREQALVRMGACDYEARRTAAAASHLNGLLLTTPEADAERLWWLAATYRRDENDTAMEEAMVRLAQRFPQSPWRLQALILAGNRYLVQNRSAEYLPHYRACAANFPNDSDADYCHWKVVWRSWMDRAATTAPLLREHVQMFPGSEKAGAALFYLALLAEENKDFAAAKRFYTEINTRFPNYYYAISARDALKRADIAAAKPSPQTEQFLATVKFPTRERSPDFRPDANATTRIERARLLERAGLERWAETEMRFGARNDGNPWPLAIEMAETAARRGDHAQALRYIKGTVPGFLFLPRDAAPLRFWRLAFPFPYRADITRYARQYDLDPFLVAALIRQESEFDPRVVSYAGAIGLMQVMPPTGRELARRLKLGRSTNARLKQPTFNLNLGTYHLRRTLDSRNGNIEETLAGYNAGGSRVKLWETWGPFRDNNEFIETIPFTQTRDYVQILLRNRDIYRWLYANEPVPAVMAEPEPAAEVKPAVKVPAKAGAAKKKAPAKKSTTKKSTSKKTATKSKSAKSK